MCFSSGSSDSGSPLLVLVQDWRASSRIVGCIHFAVANPYTLVTQLGNEEVEFTFWIWRMPFLPDLHRQLPGNCVYVKSLSDRPLEPKWEGPSQVLLTTHTTAKVEGLTPWIHHTCLKKAPEAQWTAEESGPLKIRMRKHG